jgi:hypothetical protein
MKKIAISIFAFLLSVGIFQSVNAQTAVSQQKPVQTTQVSQQNLIAEENARVEAAKEAEAQKLQVEQNEKAAYIKQLQQNKPVVVTPATSEKRKNSAVVKKNQK